MMQTFLDFLFPRRSLTGAEGEFVTAEECARFKSFPVIEEKHALQARRIQWLDAIRAGSSYHHAPLLKKAVHTFKFKRIPGLAEHLTSLIEQAPLPKLPVDAVLCPVPLHWSRQYQRGFNQAALLASALSSRKGIEVRQLLHRMRKTGHQSHRNRAERLVALQDAFVCRESHPPSFVVLIDDLATTGATLDACAHALKERGVSHVEAWVVAHG
tara:strand:+ start:112 stop:750 length:639 start_codon:yes stop_codon:yes gene_type:complete